MRVRNETPFPFAAKVTSREPPAPEAVFIVRGRFDLVHEGVAKIRGGVDDRLEQGAFSGELFREDDDARAGDAIRHDDFADMKPRAEVLFTGSCFAPNGKPVVECPVRITVGEWSKTLVVFGDREWEGLLSKKASAPKPFTEMPIDHTRAFGGPGYELNPVGKGWNAKELPNVESPLARVTSSAEINVPATFAPISSNWPMRRRHVGKAYGPSYAPRAPFFAEDFSFDFFQAAPLDQILPKYLAGDEELSLANLDREHAILSTKLPGLRLRAFMKTNDGAFREVKMNLDTLYIDGAERRVELTWRGLERVREIDLSDVTWALVASERLDEKPKEEAHYRALLEEAERDPAGAWTLPADVRELAKKAKAIDAKEPKGAEIAGVVAHGMNDNDAAKTKAAIDAAFERAGGEATTKAAREGSSGAPVAAAPHVGDEVDAIRARAAAAVAKIEDPKMRAAFADALEGAIAKAGGAKKKTADADLGPGKDLRDADLRDRDLRAVDLKGANLEGAVLSGARLDDAILAETKLARAVLDRASMDGADMSGADLTNANFTRASLAGAQLDGANLERTIFVDANLAGASLTRARGTFTNFAEANLSKAKLDRASLVRPSFERANLAEMSAKNALIERGAFLEANLTRAIFDDATISKTSFSDSNLSGARFVGARAEPSIWLRAKLEGADLSYATLRGAHFTESAVVAARFFGADLAGARFYRARIEGADFTRANLFGVDMSMSQIGATKFIAASLYSAKLGTASMRDCDLQGANVKRATMPR